MLNSACTTKLGPTPQRALEPLESPICELARLATIVSILAENVEGGLNNFGKNGLSAIFMRDAIKDEVEALAAFADDLKDQARKLRGDFYSQWNEVVA